MKTSDKGIQTLKYLEGCVKIGDKHIIYDDQSGKPLNITKPLPSGATIGYGHLIKSGENFRNGITEDKATLLLKQDISWAEHIVENNIKISLLQHQFDALVILAYNIGEKNFTNSTVVKYVNNPNFQSSLYPTIDSAWKAWNRSQGKTSKGLINRRQHELNLYLCGTYIE